MFVKVSDGGNTLKLLGLIKDSFTILKQFSTTFISIWSEEKHVLNKICTSKMVNFFHLEWLMMVAHLSFMKENFDFFNEDLCTFPAQFVFET